MQLSGIAHMFACLVMNRSKNPLTPGAVGGVAGGAFNAGIIHLTGAWERIADKFDAPSPGLAFVVHMIFSGLMGLIYCAVFRRGARTLLAEMGRAVAYSVALYLFIASTVMTVRFGAPQLGADGSAQLARIIVGHAIFGVILGGVRFWFFGENQRKHLNQSG